MFKRSADKPMGEPTVVGRGSRIAGSLRVKGRVQIDGEVEGQVVSDDHVSIGPSGSVIGELSAAELVVGGRIEGTVRVAGTLHVVNGGCAIGVLQYSSIQVDRGGALEELSAEDLEKLSSGAHDATSEPQPALVEH